MTIRNPPWARSISQKPSLNTVNVYVTIILSKQMFIYTVKQMTAIVNRFRDGQIRKVSKENNYDVIHIKSISHFI